MLIGISGPAGCGKDTVAGFLAQDAQFVIVALADPIKRICKEVYDFTDEQLWGPSASRNAPDTRYVRRPARREWTCTECCHRILGNPFEEKAIGPLGPKTCYVCHKQGESLNGEYHLVSIPVEHLTPRHALQQLGTEWGRTCYPNTWVDLCIRTARKLLDDHSARYTQKHGVHHLEDNRIWEEADRIEANRVRGVAVPDVRFRNEMAALREAGARLVRVVRPGAGLSGSAGAHVSEMEQREIPDSEFDRILYNEGTLDDLRGCTQTMLETLRSV
jgi:hypothetical protein